MFLTVLETIGSSVSSVDNHKQQCQLPLFVMLTTILYSTGSVDSTSRRIGIAPMQIRY